MGEENDSLELNEEHFVGAPVDENEHKELIEELLELK